MGVYLEGLQPYEYLETGSHEPPVALRGVMGTDGTVHFEMGACIQISAKRGDYRCLAGCPHHWFLYVSSSGERPMKAPLVTCLSGQTPRNQWLGHPADTSVNTFLVHVY